MTPMCAAPLAPPPDKTSQTLGRDATAVVSLEYAVIEINVRNTTQRFLKILFMAVNYRFKNQQI